MLVDPDISDTEPWLTMPQSDDHNRLLLAVDAAGLDLWENDLIAGKVTHPATRTLAELGYSQEETGDSMAFWMGIMHPEDLPAIEAALGAYRDGRSDNYRAEFRLRSKQGDWIWYANYSRVMDGSVDSGMNCFIGVTFNINERKRREAFGEPAPEKDLRNAAQCAPQA